MVFQYGFSVPPFSIRIRDRMSLGTMFNYPLHTIRTSTLVRNSITHTVLYIPADTQLDELRALALCCLNLDVLISN